MKCLARIGFVWLLMTSCCVALSQGAQAASPSLRIIKTNSPDVIAFSPDEKTLFTATLITGKKTGPNKKLASDFSEVVQYDVRTCRRRRQRRITFPTAVEAMAISPNGRTLVTSASSFEATKKNRGSLCGELRVWNLRTGKMQHRLRLPFIESGLTFSPDGRYLAAGGSLNDDLKGQAVFVYDCATWKSKRTFKGFEFGGMDDVAFSRSSTLVAGVSLTHREGMYGELMIWNLQTGKCLLRLTDQDEEGGITGPLTFDTNEKSIFFGRMRVNVPQKKGRISTWRKPRDYHGLAQSSGRMLAVTVAFDRGSTFEIWNLKSGRRLRTIPREGDIFYPVALSTQGHLFAAVGENGQTKVYFLNS
jgi:WD40 repeat protein